MLNNHKCLTDKKKLAQWIGDCLDLWIGNPHISLQYKDPFTLLIAVLLSSRCTDKKVNQVTPKLFALANNPYDMALLSPNQVEEVIRSRERA